MSYWTRGDCGCLYEKIEWGLKTKEKMRLTEEAVGLFLFVNFNFKEVRPWKTHSIHTGRDNATVNSPATATKTIQKVVAPKSQ